MEARRDVSLQGLSLGWRLCRTKFPEKFFIPKRNAKEKVKQKVQKTPRNVSENLKTLFSCLRVYHRHFFHSFVPAISNTISSTISNFHSQQESLNLALRLPSLSISLYLSLSPYSSLSREMSDMTLAQLQCRSEGKMRLMSRKAKVEMPSRGCSHLLLLHTRHPQPIRNCQA